jgi:NADPH-dependent 2,4-dienoyl-CoA reductase/sulfur reductase-like enzyme
MTRAEVRRQRVVVVGGVAAGMSAASQAKRRGPDWEVVVLEAGPYISYGTCGIPYNVLDPTRRVDDLVVLTAAEALDKRKLDVRLGFRATAVDLAAATVYATDLVNSKDYAIGFDRLVLATGAQPIVPNVDGVNDLKGIFALRDLLQADALKQYLRAHAPRKALVLGCGSSGMEMADAFAKLGLEVTILEKERSILPRFGDPVTEVVTREVARQGTRLVTGSSVLFFKGEGGRVVGVETDQGFLEADLVLLATGARPSTELATMAGIRLGVCDAIDVDQRQETSVKGVFAAGDCSTVHHRLLDRPVYFPLGVTANKQGRVAGANATGADERFKGIVGTVIFTAFGLEMGRTGLTPSEAVGQGYQVSQTTIRAHTRGHAFPGSKDLQLTILYDERSGLLLGAEAVGGEFVARRLDALAAALYGEFTLDDLAGLDLAYTPPLGPVWDPLLVAANVARKSVI